MRIDDMVVSIWTRKHYAYILCEDETSISGWWFSPLKKKKYFWSWMACNGPLFGLFYFSSSVKWDLFWEVSQNVLRFIFIMKLNQNNIVFAWSFADFGALSDSFTDGPNHHWYHHVDTLLILGWWLADPRWCNSKVSFWCWQVLIHSRFWSGHQPPGALCGKDRGSAGSVAVFEKERMTFPTRLPRRKPIIFRGASVQAALS